MIDDILKLHEDMRPFIEKCPMSIKKYNRLIHAIDKKGVPYIRKVHLFLIDVYTHEYKELVRIRNLPHICEAMWDNYALFGVKNLPEQKLFRVAADKVAKRFRIFFKELSDERKEERNKKRIGRNIEVKCNSTSIFES